VCKRRVTRGTSGPCHVPVKALYLLVDVVSCCRFVVRDNWGKIGKIKISPRFCGLFHQKFSNEHEAIIDALATRSSARALLTKFMDRMGVKYAPHSFRLSQGAPTGGAI
jgi:hypothetical protein